MFRVRGWFARAEGLPTGTEESGTGESGTARDDVSFLLPPELPLQNCHSRTAKTFYAAESLAENIAGSLVANGFHRIEPRSFHRGINPKYQAHGDRNYKRQKDGTHGHDGGPAGEQCDQAGHHEAENNAEASADERDHHGLNHELADDIGLSSPYRAAHADLAGSFENAGQHDVHDSDATDQQRDGSDRN